MSCRSIWVVEDDEDIRRQVVQAVGAEDHTFHFAENGKVTFSFFAECKTMMETIDKHDSV